MRSMTPTDGTFPAPVLGLDDMASRDPSLVGAKAAALAVARGAGLPVLDGFVIPVDVAAQLAGAGDGEALPEAVESALHSAWRGLAEGGRSLVARSSSPHEDGRTWSMAGQFESVLDLRSWGQLLAAVRDVVASADGGPMAVLVQPFLVPAWGGVMFGADPVTGRTDRLVVSAVPGGPHRLVSGEVDGTQMTLTPRGRLLDDGTPRRQPGPACRSSARAAAPSAARASVTGGEADGATADESRPVAAPALCARSTRRRLVRLARAAARVFDGPQDIEWAIDRGGRLLLLQARPITTLGDEVRPEGPILGPGPVAETFPAPLSPLEEVLWIPPLREGLRRALALTGAVPARRLRTSSVVVTINGHAAADLELLGVAPGRRSLWRRLDPRPPARRLGAAWRVGRLRAALPGLATDIVATVDTHLAAVPALETLAPTDLVRLLERSAGELISLHGYEVLAGQLLDTMTDSPTGASVALRMLADARAADPDTPDKELVAHHPVLLALVPPAISTERPLLPTPALLSSRAHDGEPGGSRRPDGRQGPDPATVREALRLRVRWVHELTVRAALALGDELARRGVLKTANDIRHLRLADVRAALGGQPVTIARRPAGGPPLPAAFRLAGEAIVVPIGSTGGSSGHGAGGGRGSGPVHIHSATGMAPASAPVPSVVEGAVLVVPTLDPALAPLLPGLGGLVAETGSVLSHLAILAREHGVPTVVGLSDATDRYAEGTWVVVDGTTGEVEPLGDEEWRAA